MPLCVATTGIGYAVRVRTRLAEDLAARTRELEAQRERTAELAVAVERTRLAAELDATARDRVREMIALADGGQDDAFARIERFGRDSLNDMRALLGVLRSDGRAPQPTLASSAHCSTPPGREAASSTSTSRASAARCPAGSS